MQKKIKKFLEESARFADKISKDQELIESITLAAQEVINALSGGGKLIVFGDGGSAADSQHFVGELIGRFRKERTPIPAIALTTNTSTLTAIANDYGFEETFSRQMKALAKKGDVAMGISTSGNSKNVLKAIEEANKLKILTVGLAGESGGGLKALCKHAICVPSGDTPRVQEAHIKIIHIIAELVEEALCG